MFWKNWSWTERILSVVLPSLTFVIVYPVFERARVIDGHRSCQSNLKQIGLAFAQYEQDYDEHFQPVITGGAAYGWADSLQPYLRSTILYHCPQNTSKGQQDLKDADPRQDGYIDYPFNAGLEQKSLNSLDEIALQIVSLDGDDRCEVTNARYCLTEIPLMWFSNQDSPLHRHFLGSGNYLFADGHVKAMTPEQYLRNKYLVF